MSKQNNPVLSLLVPICNVEKYLNECLDSARNQTFKDIEIICINDGSTDSSPQIVKSYIEADSRFKMIDKANSGYGDSMNMGLDLARGEYIGILESDDFFELDALEAMIGAARKADADVVKADFWLYWSQPKPKNEVFGWVEPSMAGVLAPLDNLEVFYRKPSIWSAIYKRSFLNDNDIRFLPSPGASYQDAAFNFKVWAAAKKIVLLDKRVLHYRQDNEKSSVNSPGKVYCVCDEYAEMLRWLDTRPDGETYKPILTHMRHDVYMWNYNRLSKPLQREFIVRMAQDWKAEDESGVTAKAKLEPEKLDLRRLIIADPLAFHDTRQMGTGGGPLGAFGRYLKAGGIKSAAHLVKYKLGR